MNKSRSYFNGKYVPQHCCWLCDPANKRKEYPDYEMMDWEDEMNPLNYAREEEMLYDFWIECGSEYDEYWNELEERFM